MNWPAIAAVIVGGWLILSIVVGPLVGRWFKRNA